MCLQFLQSGAETGILGQAGLCNKTLQTRKQTTGKTLVNLVNPGVFIVMDTGFPKVHKCSVMSMWRTWSKFSHSTFMWVRSIKLGSPCLYSKHPQLLGHLASSVLLLSHGRYFDLQDKIVNVQT